jgi:Skp family chaperone for outer membrane proteins
MKLFSILLFVLFSMNVVAQRRDDIKQRVESQRIAFITEKLELSPEEAQKFWPIYNQFTDEIESVRRELNIMRRLSDKEIKSMSDKDAEKYNEQILSQQQKLIDLQKRYQSDLKSTISVQKIALLYKAEFDFKRILLKRIKSAGMQSIPDNDE